MHSLVSVAIVDDDPHVHTLLRAILGLDIAIHHPERLTKLYAFAANSDPNGVADKLIYPNDPPGDVHASAEYRKRVAEVLAVRAVLQAKARR